MNDFSITISRHAKIRKAFKRLATVLHSDEKEGASSFRRVSHARREVTRYDHNHSPLFDFGNHAGVMLKPGRTRR